MMHRNKYYSTRIEIGLYSQYVSAKNDLMLIQDLENDPERKRYNMMLGIDPGLDYLEERVERYKKEYDEYRKTEWLEDEE